MSYSTGILKTAIEENIRTKDDLILDVDLQQAQESLKHLVRTEYIHRFSISDTKLLTETAFRKLQSAAFNHGCSAIVKVDEVYAPVIVWPTKRDALGQPKEGVFISPYRVDATTGKFQVLHSGKPQDLTEHAVLEFAEYQGFFNGNTLMGPVGMELIKPYIALYNLQMRKLSLTIYKSVPMLISLLTNEQNQNIINAYKTNPRDLITTVNTKNNTSNSYGNKGAKFQESETAEIVKGKISRLDTQFDTNEEIRALDAIMDKCRDALGIRKEPRFKAERKTNDEIEAESDSFLRSEKVQEEQLNIFLDQFNKLFKTKIELKSQLDTIYSDNLEIQSSSSQFKSELGNNENNE